MVANAALLEIACFRPDHAILAHKAGADRIELCDDRDAGGVSPSLEWLQDVKAQVSVPVFVMIRPRGGNFNYSVNEFEKMRMSIDAFRPYTDGYVFGILDGSQEVDVGRTAELVQLAQGKPCTFHRAFDETSDQVEALEKVIGTGCEAVLTSGGAPTAEAGAGHIGQLVRLAGGRITVIIGGNVRSSNIALLRDQIGARIFHSSAIPAGMDMPCEQEVALLKSAVVQKQNK